MPTDESVWPTVENSRFAVIQVRDRTEAAPSGDKRAILAISRIVEQSRIRLAAPGYTERPDRLQFMAGQVGLYRDDTNSH